MDRLLAYGVVALQLSLLLAVVFTGRMGFITQGIALVN